jgi:hypothetical protein
MAGMIATIEKLIAAGTYSREGQCFRRRRFPDYGACRPPR